MKVKNLLLGTIVGIVTVVSVFGISFELMYWKKIYPGVKMGGVNMGGLDETFAQQKILKLADSSRKKVLVWGVNEWTLSDSEIGLKYNDLLGVKKALSIGRTGNFAKDAVAKFNFWNTGINIDPVWSWNEDNLTEAIASISAQIDIPAQEPEIIRNKDTETITVTTGENGQEVNKEALKEKIIESLNHWAVDKIAIPISEIKPKLSNEQVEKVRNRANLLLGKKILIEYLNGVQKWEINDDQLLTWLDPQTGLWKTSAIRQWVTELSGAVNKDPQNATFRFLGQGKVEEFKPAKDGVTVLEENTTESITLALDKLTEDGSLQTVELETRSTKPQIETGDVNTLGIKELIGKGESWFTGSITNRIFNLKKAADMLNGVLVPPGETFSFNKTVGEISANTGYKQAYIIKEGKTILGDGGGVCQVSSTLFRTILAAGLPIEERTAHAYRVSYYEVKYQPGFDATVFQPSPDFKFKNDTSAYILIQTVYDENAKYLSFELYGTNDGRKVEISKARVWELIPPPPDLYQDDPTQPVGKVVQTEHAAWGAKVAFDWKVTRGGDVLQERTFYSNYSPWQAVYLRGTKTN